MWSVTSFSELAREAREVERCNRLHPAAAAPRTSHVGALPGRRSTGCRGDRLRARLAAAHRARTVDAPFTALGTDGFGRSDTRAALRRFFEVDRHHIVLAALDALARAGRIEALAVRAGDPALRHRHGGRRVVELLIVVSCGRWRPVVAASGTPTTSSIRIVARTC